VGPEYFARETLVSIGLAANGLVCCRHSQLLRMQTRELPVEQTRNAALSRIVWEEWHLAVRMRRG
jgi:hypothetical protein